MPMITDADVATSPLESSAPIKSETERVSLAWMRSPLGPLLGGATDHGICLLEFTHPGRLEPQLARLRALFRGPVGPGIHPHLHTLERELAGYFAGETKAFTVPLVVPGTPFQLRVWEALRAIPYGETRSYEQLAQAIGEPEAIRAVGRTNGLNRIAIVIPCHRVINKNGALGGYGGGLTRKRFLLELERGSTQAHLSL